MITKPLMITAGTNSKADKEAFIFAAKSMLTAPSRKCLVVNAAVLAGLGDRIAEIVEVAMEGAMKVCCHSFVAV